MTSTPTDRPDLLVAGDALFEAERGRVPIRPLAETLGAVDPGMAYAIQQRVVARRLAAGESIVGWKLGLTSAAMQAQLGVDQPDYAPLLSGQLLESGATVARSDLIAPRVEAEIAVRLARPLRGPGVTLADVIAATDSVAPAIEVIDSRIAAWKITLADTIADLASCARVVIAAEWIPLGDLDLRLIGVVMERDGEVVATGAGAACLGHPLAAVGWAANTLGALGVTLEPGMPIMPGAVHASVPVTGPSGFRAHFDRLGSVEVRFA
jgi:2-oxopent-4-enoate hydratase